MDVRQQVHNRPMRPFQYLIVGICIAITMVDGYEVLIMAFVAPYLAPEWGIDQIEVGYLLSAGLAGMALGAIFLSSLADRIGRRNQMIFCLTFIVIGMIVSGLAQNVTQMVLARLFAGLFIGGIVASLNVIVAEFSNNRRRGTIMGVYGIGLPAGAAVGGAVTATVVGVWGWRGPFFLAAAVTAILLVIVVVAMPESVDYLIEKRPKNALAKYNTLARRLGVPTAEALPQPRSGAEVSKSPLRSIFSGLVGRRTAVLWVGFGSLMGAFYFANTWTATLVAEATGDPSIGVTTGVLITVGGVVGALIFAVMALVMRPRIATALLMFFGAVAYVLYANFFENVGLALFLSVFVGLAANGGVAAFYAISPYVYPAVSRATAIGLMIGVGRGVSILAPLIVGFLLARGWTPEGTYQAFAILLVVAGAAVLVLDRSYRGRTEDPEPVALST